MNQGLPDESEGPDLTTHCIMNLTDLSLTPLP